MSLKPAFKIRTALNILKYIFGSSKYSLEKSLQQNLNTIITQILISIYGNENLIQEINLLRNTKNAVDAYKNFWSAFCRKERHRTSRHTCGNKPDVDYPELEASLVIERYIRDFKDIIGLQPVVDPFFKKYLIAQYEVNTLQNKVHKYKQKYINHINKNI